MCPLSELPRLLVVDASILFSFFKGEAARRKLTDKLLAQGCKLVSPDFALEELLSDREKVMKYAGIDELGFVFLLSLLTKKIETVDKHEYEGSLQLARGLSPHPEDDPYFALALSLNSAIWSDEKAFTEQSTVKVYPTRELLKLLSEAKP